ncbi:MAG: type VI secretion system baseplate subunit TssG [Magnetococcus sp. DMHC-1]
MSNNSFLSLIEQWAANPTSFEFVQAVRLLELAENQARNQNGIPFHVGSSAHPREEVVRFGATPALRFPTAELERVEQRMVESARPTFLMVNFMGLTGPVGVLPRFYTEYLVSNLRDQQSAPRDFFDLFNHRLISLFYRASVKYRLPLAYERCDLSSRDAISATLDAMVGLGTDHLKGRLPFADHLLVYYGGHFARQPRSAVVLERMLSEYFRHPVTIIPFHGRWLTIVPHERTRLPGGPVPEGQFNRLGDGAILGDRTWEMQGGFLLNVGHLSYADFCWFMPGKPGFAQLVALTRTYVGPGLDFDIQVTLAPRQIPLLQLDSAQTEKNQPRLGWNTWVRGNAELGERSDAVFGGKCVVSGG